jgi:hypothetical protein
MKQHRSPFFLISIIAACIAAAFPYFQDKIFGYGWLILGMILSPFFYVLFFGIAIWLSKGSKTCWWLATLIPVAFGPISLVIYSLICWKIHGFAP